MYAPYEGRINARIVEWGIASARESRAELITYEGWIEAEGHNTTPQHDKYVTKVPKALIRLVIWLAGLGEQVVKRKG
jgi:hypothetical protein